MNTKPWDARMAARLVRPLVSSAVHPNHLTAVRLLVGLGGAVYFALGDAPNTAALLIAGSSFLDHTDGELARMSGKTSRFGHNFDLLSDALVTVGMFVGIGIGLASSDLGGRAVLQGLIAGIAVAAIFQIRNVSENQHGKSATRQPQWAGFEVEDILYLMPVVTILGGLKLFLIAAAVGSPIALLVVTRHFVMIRRSRSAEI